MNSLLLAVFFIIVISASAYVSVLPKRSFGLSMVFGKSGASKPVQKFQVNKGTANSGTYVPDGLTAEQYQAALKKEAEAAAKKKVKFPVGKNVETLTEWIEKCEAKGLTGKDMNLKGHRMVKVKYDSFTTPYSPI